MRKFLSKTFVFAVLVVVVMSSTAYASEIGQGVVDGINLRLRTEPSTTSSVLATIPDGTVLSVLEVLDQWYKVEYDGLTGYVGSYYVVYTPHQFEYEISTSSSCTADSTTRKFCTVCGYEEITVTPASGHNLKVEYRGLLIGSSYSCETGGTKSTYCQNDGCTYSLFEEVPPGHVVEHEVSVSSDCSVDTYEREYCIFCDWEEVTVVPAIGHDLEITYYGFSFDDSFSCQTGGIKWLRCKRAVCTYEERVILPPGHDFYEVSRIDPTYHSTGTSTMQCNFCGYREFTVVPMLVDDALSGNIFSLGQAFMSGTWKLFGIYVPGFDFTFGGLMIGMALASISLSVIYMLFGFGRRSSATAARTSSTNNAKISKEREKDEY